MDYQTINRAQRKNALAGHARAAADALRNYRAQLAGAADLHRRGQLNEVGLQEAKAAAHRQLMGQLVPAGMAYNKDADSLAADLAAQANVQPSLSNAGLLHAQNIRERLSKLPADRAAVEADRLVRAAIASGDQDRLKALHVLTDDVPALAPHLRTIYDAWAPPEAKQALAEFEAHKRSDAATRASLQSALGQAGSGGLESGQHAVVVHYLPADDGSPVVESL